MDFSKKLQAEHYLVAFLLILAVLAVIFISFGSITHFLAAALTGAVLDYVLMRLVDKRRGFPWLGLITGLIISVVLLPNPLAGIAAAAIAILGKYLIRYKGRNIFNPAAFGMLIAAAFLAADVSWWAAAHFIVIPLGLLVAYKIRRLETSLSFLLVYFAIFAVQGTAMLSDFTIYFFAFVMALEPVTTPFTRKGKVVFGTALALLTALVPVGSILLISDILLWLLVMNVFTHWLNRWK